MMILIFQNEQKYCKHFCLDCIADSANNNTVNVTYRA